jgi:REP element-mobilizing transposase RayT
MGQSLSQIYIHLTFATKDRYPFISLEWERDLHAYMAGILKNLESPALIINSVEDHVHVLFRMSKNYAFAKVVEIVKKESSKWIKNQAMSCGNFAWQNGYGGFSVSSSKVDAVVRYIENQKEHHKRMSYQEEVERFFKEYGMVYNSEYYWR